RSKFQYGWSTPVYWRHDGIDEVDVLGGDFEPNQRLMAYNLADGAERWWVAGLPPCGKSTPVIGSEMVSCAAPDITLTGQAEQWDITTRHPSPPTTRSTLRRRRAWWLCWMAARN